MQSLILLGLVLFLVKAVHYCYTSIKEEKGKVYYCYRDFLMWRSNLIKYNEMYVTYWIKEVFLYIKILLEVSITLLICGAICILLISKLGNVSDSSDKLAFTGTIIAGILGTTGTLVAMIINNYIKDRKDRKKEHKEICLLMKQLLYSYNRVIGLSEQGRPELSYTSHNENSTEKIIFLDEWTKYLIHLDNLEDLQCIILFLKLIDGLNIQEIIERDTSDMVEGYRSIRDTFYGIGKEMIRLDIQNILYRYDKVYLKGIFKKKYMVEYPYQ